MNPAELAAIEARAGLALSRDDPITHASKVSADCKLLAAEVRADKAAMQGAYDAIAALLWDCNNLLPNAPTMPSGHEKPVADGMVALLKRLEGWR